MPYIDESIRSARSVPQSFLVRVLMVVGVIAAAALLLLLLWSSIEVILLIFGGLLFAVLLDYLAEVVKAWTGLKRKQSLTIVLITLVLVVGVAAWLFYPLLMEQLQILIVELPLALVRLETTLRQYPVWAWALDRIPDDATVVVPGARNLLDRIGGYFSTLAGVAVYVLIVIAAGIYFAYDPKLYKEGVIRLFPLSLEERVREILDTLGITLRRWLVGRVAIMTVNGVLTALGLWALGIPLPWILGLLTALLNFIPNIGPFLSALPAILLALPQGVWTAFYVAILYLVIQLLEGFVLTPLVQQQTVELPPVLILAAQVLLGLLVGFLGVLLAVPIVAVIYVLVRMIYVEDMLGRRVDIVARDKMREERAEGARST